VLFLWSEITETIFEGKLPFDGVFEREGQGISPSKIISILRFLKIKSRK
jgi:hypothetical protein